MTLIVGVGNKDALAFAADSIGSVEHKTFIVNKLFEVSDNDPIGVAVAGSSDFMGVLLETIIKEFRKSISKQRRDTLQEYVDDFIHYLKNSEYINNISLFTMMDQIVNVLIYLLQNKIDTAVKEAVLNPEIESKDIEDQSEILTNISKQTIQDGLNEILLILNDHSLTQEIEGLQDIQDEHLEQVIAEKQDQLDKIFCSFGTVNHDLFVKVLRHAFQRDLILKQFTPYSQLIFFGFGKNDFVPKIKAINLFKKLENKIVLVEQENMQINDGFIEPYAQGEDVRTSILGIGDETAYKLDKKLQENLQNLSKKDILNQEQIVSIKNAVRESLKSVRREAHSSLMETVRFLSKSELGKIAESFVGIGSMKKRMNMGYETIGGPIDVAIVTKADGFIWIKRKYYFTPELNYNYFNRLIGKNEGNGIIKKDESS